MRKLLTLILILCTIAVTAQMRGGAQYDPGAIRSDGTNASDTVTFNRIKTAAGTAAAPAYSFSSDPDTGIYSPGADTLGFGVGGANVASLSSTGLSLASPLAVANGGTGATTAAAGLAALGGASLNGSSTVAFSSNGSTVYAPLGVDPWKQSAGSIELSPDEDVSLISGYAGRGLMQVDMSSGQMCLFWVFGGETKIIAESGLGGAFAIAKDNAGTYNFYGADGDLRVQNKMAATATARINYQFRSLE